MQSAHRYPGDHLFRNTSGLPRPETLDQRIDAFCARPDAILPRGRGAVGATTDTKVARRLAGTPLPPVPSRIVWEFTRVTGLVP